MWISNNKRRLAHCQSDRRHCLLSGQIHNGTWQRWLQITAFCKLPALLVQITIKLIYLPCMFPHKKWTPENQSEIESLHCPGTMYYHLPGARMSGLPFVATVFWRFMTRLCLPGMVKAWFSLPPCVCGMFCRGGKASEWTWERGKIRFYFKIQRLLLARNIFSMQKYHNLVDVLKAKVQYNENKSEN